MLIDAFEPCGRSQTVEPAYSGLYRVQPLATVLLLNHTSSCASKRVTGVWDMMGFSCLRRTFMAH